MVNPNSLDFQMPETTLLGANIRKVFAVAAIEETVSTENFTLTAESRQCLERLRLAQIKTKALVDPTIGTPAQVQAFLAQLHTRIEVYTDLLDASN